MTQRPGASGSRVVPPHVLEAVLDDAAAASGVDRGSLTIVSTSSVRWPDGSLGCPEPGRFYTQALVDGWWMVIEAGDQELDYRGGSGSSWRRCPTPGVGIPADPGTY